MKHISIITGEINSGKTSFLEKQVFNRKDVGGILTPKINGKRFFKIIATQEIFEMETIALDSQCLQIGNYFFSKDGFEKANKILIDSVHYLNLVIDEIGPLEINEKGFYNTLLFLLQSNFKHHLILVVRKKLIDTVLQKFSIADLSFEITDINKLPKDFTLIHNSK
jgi:nucleoside-triphosphatase THEP1